MSRAKQKGTAWETAIVRYLAENGATHTERRALKGNKDCGDIAGIPGVVIEAKAATGMRLAEWLDETEAERVNDGAAVGACWIKRRGKTSPGAGYVLMSGAQLVALLQAAGYMPTPEADRA